MLKLIATILVILLFLVSTTPALATEEGEMTVGIIVPASDPFALEAHKAFMSSLRSSGLTELVKFIKQSPQADTIALKNTARKLITLKADVLVTYGTPATMATLGERPSVPVIYGGVYKPIHDSISSPGAFGVCINPPLSSLTRYMAAASRQKSIGILYCNHEKDSLFQMKQMVKFTKMAGLTGKPLNMGVPSEVASTLSGSDVGFFFITTSSCTQAASSYIKRISSNRRIPTASLISIENLHPVIAHYCNASEAGRMMAKKLTLLLKGNEHLIDSGPCVTSSELVFDIGEARRLGLSMPMELVTGATKVIY